MKTVKIVGVPEHFNLPWHLCIENDEFGEFGIDLQWTDVPEGTGKMCDMLANNETDFAIILTEGIIKNIATTNSSYIVQTYVKSPLLWGIHADYNAPYQSIADLEGKTAAISRFGSGSHLMSVVNANLQNWDINQLNFEVVNTIDNAVVALQNKTADYFMWERFMTKPMVDAKVFKKIGECPTPWPSFVVAVRKQFYDESTAVVEQILEIINNTTCEFKIIPSIDKTLASRYNLEVKDVQEWLSLTQWSQKKFDQKSFNLVVNQLSDLNLIQHKPSYQEFVK
ncbi:ABC transporter substrate-binding protein [Flavobacterium agricola]|uniref:ABC transporter substrate-binding protein n=1 Tax=Flavobacterium agricola TaxID=2870839 RepID=A0ABY6M0H9_9FLAO|nr:substrate-binding domain-containing protein [Flavobacterium agricola]UYW02059.1 ABC transporter substrate-binding protein [Flavobacterium agricola]